MQTHIDVDPFSLTTQAGYPDQFVDEAFAELSVMHHCPQLLIKRQVGLLPVDARMRGRKIEIHEVGEIPLDGLFPWTIVVIRHGAPHLLPILGGRINKRIISVVMESVITLMQPMADQSAQAVVSRSRHRKTLRRKIRFERE